MHVSFNETNTYILKIIKDADISGFGDAGRIDPTSRILILPAVNKLLMNKNLSPWGILILQILLIQSCLSLGRPLKIIQLT